MSCDVNSMAWLEGINISAHNAVPNFFPFASCLNFTILRNVLLHRTLDTINSNLKVCGKDGVGNIIYYLSESY